MELRNKAKNLVVFQTFLLAAKDPGGGEGGKMPDDIVNPVLPTSLSSLSGEVFLEKFINLAISMLFIAGSIVFFFILVTGAIKWIASGGDKTKLESGQKQITSALTGLAILFCIFAIIKLIETLFGINILKFNLPTL